MRGRSRHRLSRGTARPKLGQNVHADTVRPTRHTLPKSRDEVLIRRLAAAKPGERAGILTLLRKDGSPKALAAAEELERRWAEQRATRASGPWRVVPVELTSRARPKGITRDGDKEATQDGLQWRVSYNGTFMGYALSEEDIADMLGEDAYDSLEDA